MSAFVSPWTPLLERSLQLPVAVPRTVLRKGTQSFCRSLTLTCQNSPCWRSCERCITSFLSSRSPWAAIADSAQSIDASAHAWSSRGMCVNWNVLQYLCAIVELQPVATRLPGVRLPLESVKYKTLKCYNRTIVCIIGCHPPLLPLNQFSAGFLQLGGGAPRPFCCMPDFWCCSCLRH